MNRRNFITRATVGLAAIGLAPKWLVSLAALDPVIVNATAGSMTISLPSAFCSRCGGEKKTMPFVRVRPGSHTWFTPSNSDFNLATPPSVERVCGDCITDNELMREVSPVAEFALGVLISNATQPPLPQEAEGLKALEHARCCFMVRNNEPDGRNRRAALRAIGLESTGA